MKPITLKRFKQLHSHLEDILVLDARAYFEAKGFADRHGAGFRAEAGFRPAPRSAVFGIAETSRLWGGSFDFLIGAGFRREW